MQVAAGDLWGAGRRSTPGEIAWATITEPTGEVSFIGDGWVWRQDEYVAIVVTGVEEARAGVTWATGDPVQLVDGDTLLHDALLAAGYQENVDAAFDLDVRLTVRGPGRVRLPEGSRSGRRAPTTISLACTVGRGDRATCRSQPDIAHESTKTRTSSFSVDTMARIAASPLYRSDLHVVAEAPDGSLAGSCIAWIRRSERNRSYRASRCRAAAPPSSTRRWTRGFRRRAGG